MPWFLSHAVFSLATLTGFGSPVHRPEVVVGALPKSESPSYALDVAPIVSRSCVGCHRAGGAAPFSLESPEDLTKRARTIARVVREATMPPWFAVLPEGSTHRFANDVSLTAQEKETLVAWLQSDDRPLGDLSKAPASRGLAPEWRIGGPDFVVEIPRAVEIAASGTMDYVNFRVATNFPEDRWVRAWEVLPTARDVVHHVLVFAVPRGTRGPADESRGYFAAYVPGNGSKIYSANRAKRLPAGCDLIFQLHYTPNGRATVDRTRLGLVFTESAPEREVRTAGIFDPKLDIPPGAENHREGALFTLPFDARILAWMPHMHARGKSFRAYRERPLSADATSAADTPRAREILLEVPRYDFNWQLAYEYATPLEVKRGTILGIEASFDNSAANTMNPDPSKRVRWGQQTTDEMLIGYIEYERIDDLSRADEAQDNRDGRESSDIGRSFRRDRAAQFAFLDDDGDDAIERGEGGVLVARAFEAADADSDGRITRAEFEAYLRSRRRAD